MASETICACERCRAAAAEASLLSLGIQRRALMPAVILWWAGAAFGRAAGATGWAAGRPS